MKCELEYENYRYLTLESPAQLAHHTNEAFQLFLDVAKNSNQYSVTVQSKTQPINGAILIWGRCTKQGRNSVMAACGFRDILSLEAIVADLVTWKNQEFVELLNQYEDWTSHLFSGLREIR